MPTNCTRCIPDRQAGLLTAIKVSLSLWPGSCCECLHATSDENTVPPRSVIGRWSRGLWSTLSGKGCFRASAIKRGYGRYMIPAMVGLLAFALRVLNLNSRSLWYDEAFAVLYAGRCYGDMIAGTVTPAASAGAADVHPLFYYFLLHHWMQAVGRSVYAVRFLSVGLGLVGLATLFVFTSRWLGRKVAVPTMMVAAVSPFVVHYAQEARMYALVAAMALLASYALTRHRWAIYAVFAALTMYAHNLGALYLFVLNLVVLLKEVIFEQLPSLDFQSRFVHLERAQSATAGSAALLMNKAKERRWGILLLQMLANLGAGLLFGPWLVQVLPGQVAFVKSGYWVPRPGVTELMRTLVALTFNLPLPAWALGPALAGALLLLVLSVFQIWWQRSPTGWMLMLAWGPVLLSFALSQWRSVYIERSFLPGALVYCTVVGWLFAKGKLPALLRRCLLLLSIALAGVGLAHHYTFHQFPNSDFAALQAHLRREIREGDRIVHDNKLSFFPAFYYDQDLPQVFLPDPPGPNDTLALPTQDALDLHATSLEATLVRQRIWFVAFDRAREEARALGLPDLPNWTWYAERCTLTEEHHVGDMGVYVFEDCGEGL